jgi:hypothetical protein
MPFPSRFRALRVLLVVAAVAFPALGAGALATAPRAATPAQGAASRVPFQLVTDRAVDDRLPQPEDRYAVAGGCYTLEAPGQGYLTGQDGAVSVTPSPEDAEPFHFQPTRLGEYLLGTNEGRDTRYDGAWWDVRAYLAAGTPRTPGTPGTPVDRALPATGVTLADAPSEDAEWRLVAAGPDPQARAHGRQGQPYLLSLPSRGTSLAVRDGRVSLVDAADEATGLVLRHVPDDDPSDDDPNGTACATWPEIDTDATGRPERAGASPQARVQGFFEAHVHGMAFEFLGGELRCGRPWHEYGVEYALGDCREERNPLNGLLEVPLGGNPAQYAATYDPVGWPTFRSWPRNRTLTHEQYYWRWLERAYLGGLRLTTNLLVDNKALCRVYPVKRNSCNEMDGVRLQAQRMFELQDYIDAQYGGPGEGWLRIVTTPAQARRTINAGRLAVVLGVEVSALFDCDELLDQPLCTEQDVDERLQEVFDMGVRQMELVNKFDNALSGVTGDGGTSGPVVNAGNKQVTGHWWDMQTCDPEPEHGHGHEGDEHDKTQIGPTDATPGNGEGVDALAGRVLDAFGGTTRGIVAPVYGPGPHCNSRGLTPLGEHLVRAMIAKGMLFDPDHMSAAAQRAALDLIENEIVPAELAAARTQRRAPVLPAVLSSHSWGNEVTYQRIYGLSGVVAPRTDDAAAFVQRWQTLRRYADEQAPAGYDFGMGYGADTNGLGGQPGPRADDERTTLVDYSRPFAAPIGGVRLAQQTSGLRAPFDINTEGVSHYGLFADWFHELRLAADEVRPGLGDEIVREMLDGAETYLGLWERAVYGANSCVADGAHLDVDDLHAALGLDLEGFLTAAGSPAGRADGAYVYCADDAGRTVPVEVRFDPAGRTAEVLPG